MSDFQEQLKRYIDDPENRKKLVGDLASYTEEGNRKLDDIEYVIYVGIGDLPPQEAMAYLNRVREQFQLTNAVYLPSRKDGTRIEKFDDSETTSQERAWDLFKYALPLDYEERAAIGEFEDVDPCLKNMEPEKFAEVADWAIMTVRIWDEKMSAFVGNSLEEKPEEGR